MALLPSIQPAGVSVQIKFSMFFDRAGVASGISKAKRAGLNRAGFAVMGLARKSIKKMGMAAPKLAVMKANSGLTLSQLAKLPGMSAEQAAEMRDSRGRFLKGSRAISSRQGVITEADRRKVLERLKEIKFRYPSAAPNPPHTHTGAFRNAITFGYDSSSESVVIGGFMPGINRIVSLHEFGGNQNMQAWAWIQPSGWRNNSGLIGWFAVGRRPRGGKWQQMGGQWVRSFRYPRRPYMAPALKEAIKKGRIKNGFGNSVNMSGRPGG